MLYVPGDAVWIVGHQSKINDDEKCPQGSPITEHPVRNTTPPPGGPAPAFSKDRTLPLKRHYAEMVFMARSEDVKEIA